VSNLAPERFPSFLGGPLEPAEPAQNGGQEYHTRDLVRSAVHAGSHVLREVLVLPFSGNLPDRPLAGHGDHQFERNHSTD